jgi:hypothetical protein
MMKRLGKAGLPACLLALAVTLTAGVVMAGEAIEVKDLWQEFQHNQQAAADKYFTREAAVSGVVIEAAMSIYATPAIRLSDVKGGEIYVVCVLPRADMLKLSDFKPGERATLIGTVRHNNTGPVVIKGCRAVASGG